MKKIVILILIFMTLSIITTSCKKEVALQKPILTIDLEKIENAEQIKITALSWQEAPNEQLIETAEFIKAEYGIDLEFTIFKDYDLTGRKTAKLIENAENDGMFYFLFTNLETLKQLAEEEQILPIDEFLKNNKTWKSLPDEMKTMYSIGDEKIWALPRSYALDTFGRAFKKQVLEKAGEELPTNLSQLYEVSKKISKLDDNFIGMSYYNPLSFNDIFYSNDTPLALSHTGYNYTSIVFDSKLNSFEDSMLKPDMENTLDYIRNLIKEKIAIQIGGRRRGQSSVGLLGTNEKYTNMYGVLPINFFSNDEYELIYGVNGSVNENINPLSYRYLNGYYVLSKNTPQPKQVINSFVSIFYGDVKGYVATSFGAPGKDYVFNGDTIVINNMNFFKQNEFSVIGTNPLINFSNMNFSASGKVYEQIIQYQNSITAKEQYINNGLTNKKMIKLSLEQANPLVFPNVDDYALSNPAAIVLESVLENAFRGFVSSKETILQYNKKMRELGQQEIIDNLNKQISSNTKYKY